MYLSRELHDYTLILPYFHIAGKKYLIEYHVQFNTAQHQFKTELCGFFSLRFLRIMSFYEQCSKNQLFEKFFNGNSQNLDNEIQFHDQHNYIFPSNEKYKQIEQFFRIWGYL